MNWPRSCSSLVVFLMLSNSLLGSESEKSLQVRWSELGLLIQGKRVSLQLAKGARVEGGVHKVTDDALVFKVKRSSEPSAYPKGKIEIPREAISWIEARDPKIVKIGRETRRIALTVGAFFGTMFGIWTIAGMLGAHSEDVFDDKALAATIAVSTGGAVLAYRALRPKGTPLIMEILPDSPGEQGTKPANKAPGASPTTSGVPPGLSLVEISGPELLRWQARRALMRQGVPLQVPDPGSDHGKMLLGH